MRKTRLSGSWRTVLAGTVRPCSHPYGGRSNQLRSDTAKFDSVINYFKNGLGNGAIALTVYYVHPGYLGQTQESGRDQGRNTLSLGLVTALAEMAWNQGPLKHEQESRSIPRTDTT